MEQITNPNTLQKNIWLCSLPSDYTGWTYLYSQDGEYSFSDVTLTRYCLFCYHYNLDCPVLFLTIWQNGTTHYLPFEAYHSKMQLSNLEYESPTSYPGFSVELKNWHGHFSKWIQKLKSLPGSALKVQEAELEARSLALQSQMSPHFYYITLFQYYDPGRKWRHKSVARYITRICHGSCVTSQTLKHGSSVSGRTWRYIKKNIYTVWKWNQSSLHYELQIDDSLLDITLPNSAFIHSGGKCTEIWHNCSPPWRVKFTASSQDNFWKIVEDTGPGFSEKQSNIWTHKSDFCFQFFRNAKTQINGLGLANIYIRMSIYFEHDLSLNMETQKKDNTFTAIRPSVRKGEMIYAIQSHHCREEQKN